MASRRSDMASSPLGLQPTERTPPVSDDVWLLGIHMTKFGKHPDKDVVDLASESVLGALADAGVSMADIDVIGAGNLVGASAGIGQQVQNQVGQTGIPVYNGVNA